MTPDHQRKPGEALFALFLMAISLAAVFEAYGISQFEALSAPGSFPIAVTAIMTVSALIVVLKTFRLPLERDSTFFSSVLPIGITVMMGLITLYAFALEPLGFLPTSLVFLTVCIKIFSKRSIGFSFSVALGSLIATYIIFRLVFTVLMPEGIVPEREILAWFGRLFAGATQ